MFRRLLFLHAESAAVRLRHSGHMLPVSEVWMVSAAESDEVCSVGFLVPVFLVISPLLSRRTFFSTMLILFYAKSLSHSGIGIIAIINKALHSYLTQLLYTTILFSEENFSKYI